MDQDDRRRAAGHVQWLGNDVTLSAEPGAGLVSVSWSDTATGRCGGSRVLDLNELGWVIDVVTDLRDRLGAHPDPVVHRTRVNLGAFLDGVLDRRAE